MLPLWLSSWYQQQQLQVQEPFHDQYEAVDEDGDWVEVITPSTKRRQPPTPPQTKPHVSSNDRTESKVTTNTMEPIVNEPVVKGLSRQERRAMARLSLKEQKKQARNANMMLNCNRNSALVSSCLPSATLTN